MSEHLGLVYHVAGYWSARWPVFERDEYVSIAYLAAVAAAPRYRPAFSVSTFLVPCMHGAIKDALRSWRRGHRKPVEETSIDALDFAQQPTQANVADYEAINRALARLTPAQRRHAEEAIGSPPGGLLADRAQRLGVSPRSVYPLRTLALAAFRRALDAEMLR